VDRTSGDEVGGPYATRQDAERAMGSFDKSPAELDVVEQDEESDGDDESTSKEGAKHASGPEGSEFAGGGTPVSDPRGGLAEHEIPDLSSFDRPQPKKPDYWWMREASTGSLPGIEAAWGWQPQMTEDIEDPLADKAPQSKDKGTDDKDSGDSSLPHVPKMPDLPGGGGGAGEAAGAAGGAGEAGGAAALAEEALPLLLV
jgi:hypothetical protein